MEDNQSVYDAPHSELEAGTKSDDVEPVYAGRRLANMVIDYAGYLGFSVISVFVIILVGGDGLVAGIEDVPDVVLGLPFYLGYYVICEALMQRTLGKLVTRTKVVSEDGGKPRFGQIMIRTLCRLIPFEAFSFLGNEAVGWHDKISKTRVVRVSQ